MATIARRVRFCPYAPVIGFDVAFSARAVGAEVVGESGSYHAEDETKKNKRGENLDEVRAFHDVSPCR